MLTTILASAKAHPRTTIAGIVASVSAIAGVAGSVHTGQLWPMACGFAAWIVASVIRDALAADGKVTP